MKSNGCSVKNCLSLHANSTVKAPSAATSFIRLCMMNSSRSVREIDADGEASRDRILSHVDSAVHVTDPQAAHVGIESGVVRPGQEVGSRHEQSRVRQAVAREQTARQRKVERHTAQAQERAVLEQIARDVGT